MTKLDLTKPYRPRGGGRAQAIEGPDGRLYGWVHLDSDRDAILAAWLSDGAKFNAAQTSSYDLIPVPEEREVTVWMNINNNPDRRGDEGGGVYISKRDADHMASDYRIACIQRTIKFTVGEGLDDGSR